MIVRHPQMFDCTHRCCMHSKKKQSNHLEHRLPCDLLPLSSRARSTMQNGLDCIYKKNHETTQATQLASQTCKPRCPEKPRKDEWRWAVEEFLGSFIFSSMYDSFLLSGCNFELSWLYFFSFWKERRFLSRRVCRGMSFKAPRCFEPICFLQFLLRFDIHDERLDHHFHKSLESIPCDCSSWTRRNDLLMTVFFADWGSPS